MDYMSSIFDFNREEKYPTRYPDNKTPAHVDILTSGLIAAFAILAASLFVILPGYSVTRRKLLFLQMVVSLFIGGVVLLGNYGHDWETGGLEMSSPYKPGSAEEIVGHIGIHISLRGINITLKGKSSHHAQANQIDDSTKEVHFSELEDEKIDYNERFSWEWTQGRFGFGYYAGQISKDFRAAVLKGVPYPILQVAEYFTFDGEGIRFGRYYRTAGWYAHILMWCAFGTWIISNILFSMVVSKAALFLLLTGLLQLTAICVWTYLRNPIEIQVPFQSPDTKEDFIFRTHFGSDYYIIIFNGVLCVIISLIIFCLDAFISDQLCRFFGIDPLTLYDECIPQKVAPVIIEPSSSENPSLNEVETGQIVRRQKTPIPTTESGSEETTGLQSTLVKRNTVLGKFIQRSFKIKNKKIAGGIRDKLEMLEREKKPLLGRDSEPSTSVSYVQEHQRRPAQNEESRASNLPHPPSFLLH